MPYTIDEHRHRFSAWAASRAATVNGCRFKVEQGKALIESAGLNTLLASPDLLPSTDEFDGCHEEWRNRIIRAAQGYDLPFTHGVAAKLINIYFKSAFICGGHHEHERVRSLHPPIDSVLLEELAVQNIGGLQKAWKLAGKIRWSKFDSGQYETVIQNIRKALTGRPLWEVEQFWRGFQ